MLRFPTICEELDPNQVDSGHRNGENSSAGVVGISIVEDDVVEDVGSAGQARGVVVRILSKEGDVGPTGKRTSFTLRIWDQVKAAGLKSQLLIPK